MWVFILAPLAMLVSVTPTFAADFTNVTSHRCYDGDTCTFTIPAVDGGDHRNFGGRRDPKLLEVSG